MERGSLDIWKGEIARGMEHFLKRRGKPCKMGGGTLPGERGEPSKWNGGSPVRWKAEALPDGRGEHSTWKGATLQVGMGNLARRMGGGGRGMASF